MGPITLSDIDSFGYKIIEGSKNKTLEFYWFSRSVGVHIFSNVSYDPQTDGIALRIYVQNFNNSLALQQIDFPYIGGFKDMINSTSLAVPNDDGMLMNDPVLLGNSQVAFQYPGPMSMQFVVLYRQGYGGLYFAAEDPMSILKTFSISGKTYSENAFKMTWEFYPYVIGDGNNFETNFSVVIAAFSGFDWTGGANMYKQWAMKQWYVEKGPIIARQDMPTWLKNVQVLSKADYAYDISSDPAFVSSNFGLNNTLIGVYGWNNGGFDHDYPEYFPAWQGDSVVANATFEAHKAGAHVIFYTNGRSVDISTKTFAENEQYMARNSSGGLYEVSYDNNSVTFAIPNPATAWWQQEVVNFTTEVVRTFGADGVYLDQVGLNTPLIDYSANRSTPTGGGTWWMNAVQHILSMSRASMRKYNPEAVLFTEGVNEVYIPYVDGFWVAMSHNAAVSINGKGVEEIPMFEFVYGGYTIISGLPVPFSNPELFNYQLSFALESRYILTLDPQLTQHNGTSGYTKSQLDAINETLQAQVNLEKTLSSAELITTAYSFKVMPLNFSFGGYEYLPLERYPLLQAYQLPDGTIIEIGKSFGENGSVLIDLESTCGYRPQLIVIRSGNNTQVTSSYDFILPVSNDSITAASIKPFGGTLQISKPSGLTVSFNSSWIIQSLRYDYWNESLLAHLTAANGTNDSLSLVLSDIAGLTTGLFLINGTKTNYSYLVNDDTINILTNCTNCNQVYVSFEVSTLQIPSTTSNTTDNTVSSPTSSSNPYPIIAVVTVILIWGVVFMVRKKYAL